MKTDVSGIRVVQSVQDFPYCALGRSLVISFLAFFSVPGTSDLLLLIFPTHEVGVITVEGHDLVTSV